MSRNPNEMTMKNSLSILNLPAKLILISRNNAIYVYPWNIERPPRGHSISSLDDFPVNPISPPLPSSREK